MDSFDFLKVFGAIRDEYILSAHETRRKQHLPTKRALLIAAIISVLLLLVGCAVVVLMGLKDVQLGNYTYDIGFGETRSGDFISLQGFAGSPEYQVAQEWQDFRQSYDADGSIIAAIGNNPTGLDSKYDLYTAYTQEMADKLEEICRKYGLALRTQLDILESQEELFRRVGGVFLKENITAYTGYIYDDGAFAFDGEADVDGEIIGFQFRRSVQGTFDDVYLNLKDISLYEEFHSTTSTGDDLLLAVSPNRGVILGDLGDCFISMNVLADDGQTITAGLLEEIAAGFDYAILKNVVKPEMDEIVPTQPPETIPSPEGSEVRLRAFRDALQTLYTSYILPGGIEVGYDEISELSSNKFAIYDIDGDGYQELILAYTTNCNAGHTFGIYDYGGDAWDLWEELRVYPHVTLWTRGNLTAGASHAHGLSAGDRVWPYTLYEYDQTYDIYSAVCQVDGWDKNYYPQDFEGNPFPDDLDLDGDGLVYTIQGIGMESRTILDNDAYQEWMASEVGSQEVPSLPWQKLTLENIEALVNQQNFLPGVSIKGYAPTADGFTAGVELLIQVDAISSMRAGYEELLEQNPDTPAPGENQEYIVITLTISYTKGGLATLPFMEEKQATLPDARVLFHLPNETGNSTDVTYLLKNPIWGQSIPNGGKIRGQVAFLQEKGNTQPLYFQGYGQTVTLDVQ